MKLISISGPVAAGKTTLLNRLLAHYGEQAAAREERPQDNPFIQQYYEDPVRWSFHSQMSFLSLYFDDEGWQKQQHEVYFFDRCLIENLVIAQYRLEQGDLTADEYAVIEKMARGIEKLMPPVEKYIYLDCPVDVLLEHAHSRGREYESSIDRHYCEKQKALYDEWVKLLPQEKVMKVDMRCEVDMDAIISFLEA